MTLLSSYVTEIYSSYVHVFLELLSFLAVLEAMLFFKRVTLKPGTTLNIER